MEFLAFLSSREFVSMSNKRLEKAKAEHDRWLRKRGVHPEQLKARKVQPRSTAWMDADRQSRQTYQTSNTVGNGFAVQPNVYTGNNLLGIAVMHKSNLVPVFNKENAAEIASMRR